VLDQMGFALPADTTVNHLVVAVRLGDGADLAPVHAEVDRLLSERRADPGTTAEEPPRTTASARPPPSKS